jgi:tetratricopeptide (TPR) repeat protein
MTEAAAIFRDAGDRKQEMIALKNLGAARHLLRGDVSGAKEIYDQALGVFRSLDRPHDEAISLTDLARAHLDLEEYEAAEHRARQAIRPARELGDNRLETWALGILGGARRALGDPASARDLIEWQLEVARETGERTLAEGLPHRIGAISAPGNITGSRKLGRWVGCMLFVGA